MKNQANEQARQNNMPMDQFESPDQEGAESDGSHSENAKPGKESKSSGKSDKERPEQRKNAKRGEFADEGEDEDWFKMKSESGTGAEVGALDDVPAEYRGLVRDYFNALNDGGKKK